MGIGDEPGEAQMPLRRIGHREDKAAQRFGFRQVLAIRLQYLLVVGRIETDGLLEKLLRGNVVNPVRGDTEQQRPQFILNGGMGRGE